MAPDVRHLDPKVIFVWLAPTLLTAAIAWLIGSVAYLIMPPDSGALGIAKVFFPVVFLAVILIIILPIYLWVRLTHEKFTYELTEEDIIIREGVITRKTTVIPYKRIQDIRAERTLIERSFGLATLEIETAGSSRVASETLIPGIANKDFLISEIMARVVKSRTAMSDTDAAESRGAAEALLSGILKELKAISLKLDTLGAGGAKKNGSGQAATRARVAGYDEYLKFKKR